MLFFPPLQPILTISLHTYTYMYVYVCFEGTTQLTYTHKHTITYVLLVFESNHVINASSLIFITANFLLVALSIQFLQPIIAIITSNFETVIKMGRAPCCEKTGLKRGPWTQDEDELLVDYIKKNGHGSWRSLPKLAGLLRCGKSCRLRWTNYLRPDIKRGPFSPEEEKLVIQLHAILGNRWAAIAAQIPGRTDNEIKNLWNTHLRKRLLSIGIDPQTHEPTAISGPLKRPPASPSTRHMAQWESARLEAEARLSMESSLLLTASTTNKRMNNNSDYFLRIWHSEVGNSFRSINKVVCSSPASQASVSGTTMETGHKPELESELKFEGQTGHFYTGITHSSSSDEVDDSSDTALQLFFDFPGQNDMSFLEAHFN